MSHRKGSSPAYKDAPGSLQKYAKHLQTDFKLTWTAALNRAREALGLMAVSFTATPTALSVVFDSTVVLNGNTVDTYLWDFGDGGTGSGDPAVADPTNIYTGAGTYRISLRVTDILGRTESTWLTITVAA